MSTSRRTKPRVRLKKRWKQFRQRHAAQLRDLRFYSMNSLHGLLMIVILFGWTNFGYTLALEGKFLNWQSLFRHHTFIDRLYSPELHPDDFIWVDASNNITPVVDPETGRKTVITDRELLDSLFSQFALFNKHRYIICDLDFDIATEQDAHLSETVSKLNFVAFPHPPGKEGQSNPAFSSVPGGKVNYAISSDWRFLAEELDRFELMSGDGQKSLPLFAYEQLTHTVATKRGWFLRYNGQAGRYFNFITVDPVIRPEDLVNDKASRYYDLNDLSIYLSVNDSTFVDSFLRNKIIVIGNFKTDIHKTAAGDMPGAMVLSNILIGLCNKQNKVSFLWVLYLWVAFTFLSSLVYSGRPYFLTNRFAHLRKLMHQSLLSLIIGKGLFVTALLLCISVLSYFIWDRNVGIMCLLLWLAFTSYLYGRWQVFRDRSKRPTTRKEWVRFFLLPLNE